MTETDDRTPVVETERLVLRKIVEEDAEFMLRLLNEPSFIRFIGDRGVRTIEDARRYIANGPVGSYARFGFGLYLVTLRALRTPIGICGLLKRDTLDDVDVGFAFVREYSGHGYGVESTAAVLDYAKRVLGLERVVAITNPDNERSIRLLAKLGFAFERTTQLAPGAPEVKLFALRL